jgi:Family of unknown function (DUF5372)
MESSEKRRSGKARNRKRATPDTSGGGAFLPDHGSIGSVLLAVNSDSRLPRWASRRSLSPTACNSIQNANASIAATRLVRITHPFHPLNGRQLPCVGERYNRYGMTLLLQIDDESACSVPPQWTDVVAVDPEIAIGGHRALFRVVDLLELVGLVDRLSKRVGRRA